MHNRVATTIALVLCALAVVVPTSAALYVAHHQSMSEASERALTLAGEVLHRSDTMGEQALAAYQRIASVTTTAGCSDTKRAQLREATMDYSYLRAIGYVSGDRIVCSAIGPRGDGIDMGPPSYVSPRGTRVHIAVSIDGSRPLLVIEGGGFAAALHPDTLLDVSTGTPGLSLGIYSRSSRLLWVRRGAFDPAWSVEPRHGSKTVFLDGKYLVAIQASTKFDTAAYVAVPRTNLDSRMHAFMLILLPIGLALGVALGAAILFLARQRASLPAVLRMALKHKEFVLHYQPIVELVTGHMVGVEALLRWPRNKQIGLRPELFVQAAEDCGLIQRFTEYVIAQVAIDGPSFFAHYPGAYISVNLSSADLRSNDVTERLRQLVATPGIAPYNIIVELTERSFLEPTNACQVIDTIQAMGIRVAIDDFGTGFSSLSHLANLSADYLKIDKVFIDAIGTSSVTSEVVVHIIEMAKSLNLTVISEGVETQDQADFLHQQGVVFAQGWLFSKAQTLTDLLQQHETD
ncbi:MAG: EAL domain-containing protein [Rhodanobacter sp.]